MSKKFDPSALSEFARHYGFHYDCLDIMELMGEVLSDMENGLKGNPSSLPMIPAYISPVSKITPGKTVIALDAGGTNLRSALVKFDDSGKAVTENNFKAPMPGTNGNISADAFFDEIADVTAPLIEGAADRIEGIGFCFSYPMEITKEADGILMAFSKEVDAPDVIGKAIGEGLRSALARRNIFCIYYSWMISSFDYLIMCLAEPCQHFIDNIIRVVQYSLHDSLLTML